MGFKDNQIEDIALDQSQLLGFSQLPTFASSEGNPARDAADAVFNKRGLEVPEVKFDQGKLLGFSHLTGLGDAVAARSAADAVFNKRGDEGPPPGGPSIDRRKVSP